MSCEGPDKPCNPALEQGERIAVRVEALDEGNLFDVESERDGIPSCNLDDIHAGDDFSIELVEHLKEEFASHTCHDFKCPLDFPSQGSASSQPTPWYAHTYVCLNNRAQVQLAPDCSVGRLVAIYTDRDTGHPYTVDGGTSDPISLLRVLITDGATCTDLATRFPGRSDATSEVLCADQYRVTLRQL